jgi:hypothetical protein
MTHKLLADHLNKNQRDLFASLTNPIMIQTFLDETPYAAEDANRSPLRVVQERQAHCLDGGLFAAAALRTLGYPALIIDLLPEPGTDDDHVLAIFKRRGCFGAIAKSNFAGLRYREPVYRSLRELVMSYFDVFFNVNGVKTMRGYTRPVHLAAFDRLDWEVNDRGADAIEKHLKHLPTVPVIKPEMINDLSPMDPLSYQAGMLGANPAGLYKPHSEIK